MDTVLILGGTGLIGSVLSRMLADKGYRVIVLTRNPRPAKDGIEYARWDPASAFMDPETLKQADHIIHLAGAGIADKRWTEARKREIVNSRVQGCQLIVKMLQQHENRVRTVVCSSGIGWYGRDRKGVQKPFTETDPPDPGFLGETCRVWEESIWPVAGLGKRLVIFRTPMVFSGEGGAFPELVKPMKAGVAAILGSGNQVVSWVHIDDLCRMYMEAVENPHLQGVYNAAAPEPVPNKQLVRLIAKTRKRPYLAVYVPAFVLKIMLGGLSIEVLKSTTVDSTKIRESGFRFIYPSLQSALNELLRVKS